MPSGAEFNFEQNGIHIKQSYFENISKKAAETDYIVRKIHRNLGCDRAPVAVLDALSNDTNPAQNG